MKIKSILLLVCLAMAVSSFKEPVAFRIYNSHGKEVTWKQLVAFCRARQVTFFGELHDNPIAHWLQLRLTRDLYETNTNLMLGAEMFEADQQVILDEYLSGLVTEKSFETEMRLWKNHKTDYKPVLDFAVEKKLDVIATNVPRRYASVVAKKGRDELQKVSAEARKFLCPLPYEVDTLLQGYRDMMKMDMGHGSSINMVYAQALKDATMAHFIGANLKPGALFLHLNGAYHSDRYEGIVHYLRKKEPSVSVATITTVQQQDVSPLVKENEGKADFIIVVDEEMTKSY